MTTEILNKSVVHVEVVHDIACPWCYVGHAQLKQAIQQAHESSVAVSVAWSPFMLNPTMPEQGMTRHDYLVGKFGEAGLARYKRVEDSAKAVGLQMNLGRITVQPNTLDTHVIITAAGNKALPIVEGLFEAFFCNGEDLTQRERLVTIAEDAGMERRFALAALNDQLLRKRVLHQANHWTDLGLQGVPAFRITSSSSKTTWLHGAVGYPELFRAITTH